MFALQKIKKIDFILIVIIVSMIVIAYGKVMEASFQQDEWYSLANYQVTKDFSIMETIRYFTQGGNVFPRPLSSSLSLINFRLFGINYALYYVCSILTHIAVSLSLYYIIFAMTKKRELAFLTGVFFAISSTGAQAITWISAYFGSAQSTFFALWSLFFYFKYLIGGQDNKKLQYAAVGLFLIAILFKETVANLILIFPFMHLILAKKRGLFVFLKEQIPLLVTIVGFFLIFFSPSFFKTADSSMVSQAASGSSNIAVLLYRSVTIPFSVLVDVYFPPVFLYKWSAIITQLDHPFFYSQKGTSVYDIFIGSAGANLVTCYLLLGILSCVAGVLSYLKKHDQKLFNIFLIFFGFVLTGGLPLIFAYSASFAVLESRYLYLPAIGGMFMLAVAVDIMGKMIGNLFSEDWKETVYYCLIGLLAIGFCIFNIPKIREPIKELVRISKVRNSIVEGIGSNLSPKSKRFFIYTKSNRSYYGKAETILPFQCGAGYLLMTRHSMNNEMFIPLLKDNHLWDLTSQGVAEADGIVFGYFREYPLFKKAISEYEVKAEELYAFTWDGYAGEFEDITISERQQLQEIKYYINKDFDKDSLKIGVPDGKTRRFYYEGFMSSPVAKIVNLKNDKEWFFCDFAKGDARRPEPNTQDYYLTYKYGLEDTYGGALVVYHLSGNGTNIYSIPGVVYGKQVAGLHYARASTGAVPKKIRRKNDGSIDIEFEATYNSGQGVQFGALLNEPVLYYIPGKGVEDIVKGMYAKVEADGKKKAYEISLPGQLKTLRSYWESDILRYQPKAFIAGKMIQIVKWSGLETNTLRIEFAQPPAKGAEILVPLLVTYAPKQEDDNILIMNFAACVAK